MLTPMSIRARIMSIKIIFIKKEDRSEFISPCFVARTPCTPSIKEVKSRANILATRRNENVNVVEPEKVTLTINKIILSDVFDQSFIIHLVNLKVCIMKSLAGGDNRRYELQKGLQPKMFKFNAVTIA